MATISDTEEGLNACSMYLIFLDVTRLQSRSNLDITITRRVFLSHNVQTDMVKTYGSQNIFLIHSNFGFGFGLKKHQMSKIESVFGKFRNPCFVQDAFILTSDVITRWLMVSKGAISLRWRDDNQWHHSTILFFIFMFRRGWSGAGCQAILWVWIS